ncbi:inorganic pyrophosphatase [Circinella umbellata]|nr:inorganic pyrophosphatase [Circinella umbellata]
MLLLKLATLALTCTVASTTALSDSVIPFLDNLVDEINHNNEKPCADVDCLYRIRTTGSYNTKDFALYLENEQGIPMSIFHDLPLKPASRSDPDIFNMIIEIPRSNLAKTETTKEVLMNPIMQDFLEDGSLRYLPNMYPTKGVIANYGAIQQTYEDPNFKDPSTGARGDNDPIDVIEISETPGFIGQVKQVKVLGGLCLIDEGSLDWKVITLDIHNPKAQYINNMDDVEKYYPGFQDEVRNWFRTYKIPTNGQANTFGFGGRYMDKVYGPSFLLKK